MLFLMIQLTLLKWCCWRKKEEIIITNKYFLEELEGNVLDTTGTETIVENYSEYLKTFYSLKELYETKYNEEVFNYKLVYLGESNIDESSICMQTCDKRETFIKLFNDTVIYLEQKKNKRMDIILDSSYENDNEVENNSTFTDIDIDSGVDEKSSSGQSLDDSTSNDFKLSEEQVSTIDLFVTKSKTYLDNLVNQKPFENSVKTQALNRMLKNARDGSE